MTQGEGEEDESQKPAATAAVTAAAPATAGATGARRQEEGEGEEDREAAFLDEILEQATPPAQVRVSFQQGTAAANHSKSSHPSIKGTLSNNTNINVFSPPSFLYSHK